MKTNDPALKRYYKAIYSWLPCSRKLKKQIIGQIQNCVEDYLAQNPDTDITQLKNHFGDPQAIAATYVENTGTAEILKDLRIRKRIVRIVTSITAAILIMWASVVTWAIVEETYTLNGAVENSVYEGLPQN